MAWQIDVEPNAIYELAKFDKSVRIRLDQFIHEKLPEHPNIFAISEPAKGKFHASRRFRVGDYRVLAEIDIESKTITIYHIGHRRNVYD